MINFNVDDHYNNLEDLEDWRTYLEEILLAKSNIEKARKKLERGPKKRSRVNLSFELFESSETKSFVCYNQDLLKRRVENSIFDFKFFKLSSKKEDFEFESYDYEYRNRHFKLIALCVNVVKNDEFICSFPDQIKLFKILFQKLFENYLEVENLLQDFKDSVSKDESLLKEDENRLNSEKRLKGDPSKSPSDFDKLPSKYKIRIGKQLKSYFQGFNALDVFKTIFVILAYMLNVLKIEIVSEHLVISTKTSGNSNKVLERIFQLLQELLGGDMIEESLRDFRFNLRSLGVTQIGTTSLTIPLKGLEELYLKELSIVLQQLVTFPTDAFGRTPSVSEELKDEKSELSSMIKNFLLYPDVRNQQAVMFWVFSNLVSNEYVPLVYTVSHLNSSFLDLHSFSLGMNLIRSDCSLFLFQKRTIKKKLFELQYDFCNLIERFGLTKFTSEAELLMMISNFNKSPTQLEPSILDEDKRKKCVRLVNCYLAHNIDYDSFVVLCRFLNNEENLLVLKSIDQSIVFNFFKYEIEDFKLQLDNLTSKDLKSSNNTDFEWINLGLPIISEDSSDDPSEAKFDFPNLTEPTEIVETEGIDLYSSNTLSMKIKYLNSNVNIKNCLVKKLKDESDIIKNIVCFENLRQKRENLKQKIDDIIEKYSSANQNEILSEHLMYKIVDDNDDDTAENNIEISIEQLRRKIEENKFRFKFFLPKETKEKYKRGRRFICEHLLHRDLEEFIKKFFLDFFKDSHWKVVNGIMAWWYFFVKSADKKVVQSITDLFKELEVNRARQKTVSIKVFGAISDVFKMAAEVRHLEGFEEQFEGWDVKLIPPEIMIDMDCMFGYCEPDREDNRAWDNEFIEHLHEWLTRDSGEKLYGVSLNDEFALWFDVIVSDLRKTFEVYGEVEFLNFLDGEKIAQFVQEGINEPRQQATDFHYLRGGFGDQVNITQYKSFDELSKNYFNLAASGSASRSRVKLKATSDLQDLKTEKPQMFLQIAKQFNIEKNPETSVSKTVMFAFTGERLPKSFYWTYAAEPSSDNEVQMGYTPMFSLNLKKESKKLRHIINADLVSFVKQSFVHDWLIDALSDITKEKVNSLLTPTQRLSLLYRMQMSFFGEKWCTPIDMKDFHFHFGKSHFESFTKVLGQRVEKAIGTPQILEDMQHILKHLRKELGEGDVMYTIKTDEEGLFEEYKKKKTIRKEDKAVIKAKKLQEQMKPNGDQNIQTPTGAQEKKRPKFIYNINMKVKNGLMSGWKMTSLFGSLFNIVLNRMCEQLSMELSCDILKDLNVLGDDTHFKQRYLVSSINHICFVNMINKHAHPDKQEISTVCTEFLKKKVNTLKKETNYSQNRMINGILYYKDFEIPEINKNLIKDTIDIFNLFLTRAKHFPKIHEKLNSEIMRNFLLNFARSSNKDKYFTEKEVQLFLDAPSLYSGFLGGPLRRFCPDFQKPYEDISKNFLDYKVTPFPKFIEIDLPTEKCKGIEANSMKVRNCLGFLENLDDFTAKLMATEREEVFKGESRTFDISDGSHQKLLEFRELSLTRKMMDEDEEMDGMKVQVEILANCPYFEINDFLDFCLKKTKILLERNAQAASVSGQLIYHNERVSSVIRKFIEKNYDKSSQEKWKKVFQTFKDLNRHSKVTENMYHKISSNFGTVSFFQMTMSQKLTISASRNFYHDEVIGFINENFTAFLIFYLLDKNFSDLKNVEFIGLFKDILVTIDYYFHHKADEIAEKIKQIFIQKIKENHSLKFD